MLRRCATTEMLTEGREEQGGHEAVGRGAGPSMKAWHRGGAAVRGWRPVGGLGWAVRALPPPKDWHSIRGPWSH